MGWFFKDSKGYKHFANSGKAVHRHVGARMLGRPLRKGEVVHHKNRDKTDNRRRNLWVFTNKNGESGWSRHNRTHWKDKKRTGFW